MIDFIWIIIGLFVVFGFTLAYIDNQQSKKRWTKLTKIVYFASILLTAIFLRFSLIWLLFTHSAPLVKTVEYIPVSNIQKELPIYSKTTTDLTRINLNKKQLIVFYKIGCPYCNAAHETIQKEIKYLPKNEVHFVEVNSKAGRFLTKEFHVEEAHTILVYKRQKDNALKFEESLVLNTKDGKQIFIADTQNIIDAIHFFKSIKS